MASSATKSGSFFGEGLILSCHLTKEEPSEASMPSDELLHFSGSSVIFNSFSLNSYRMIFFFSSLFRIIFIQLKVWTISHSKLFELLKCNPESTRSKSSYYFLFCAVFFLLSGKINEDFKVKGQCLCLLFFCLKGLEHLVCSLFSRVELCVGRSQSSPSFAWSHLMSTF